MTGQAAPHERTASQRPIRRALAYFLWSYGAWILLTWTRTWSQILVGAVLSALIAAAIVALGGVGEPWRLLEPRRLAAFLTLMVTSLLRVVRANCSLARRIWLPSRPIRTGMVVVPTEMRSEGGVTAVGIISSLIVDNQIVDLDLGRHELQYHAVWVGSTDPEENRGEINGPIEKHLRSAGVP